MKVEESAAFLKKSSKKFLLSWSRDVETSRFQGSASLLVPFFKKEHSWAVPHQHWP
jgi:hypothetical protein